MNRIKNYLKRKNKLIPAAHVLPEKERLAEAGYMDKIDNFIGRTSVLLPSNTLTEILRNEKKRDKI